MNNYYVYMLTNKRNGTIYTGVTNDLIRRVIEHKRKINEGFTKKYKLTILVWFEQTTDIRSAIEKEKQMKRWRRKWKIELIEETNPAWKDLFYEIGGTEAHIKEIVFAH